MAIILDFEMHFLIGGPRGACWVHAPLPMGHNSFIFTHIFAKKHLHHGSTPHLRKNPGSATVSPIIFIKIRVSDNSRCCNVIFPHKVFQGGKKIKTKNIFKSQ